MRILGIVVLCAVLGGCAASREEASERLGEHYIGRNVDALVSDFGPPVSTLKINNGDTSYIWQIGNENETIGGVIIRSRTCKVSVVASKTGIVTLLNTEDSNAGGSTIGGAVGIYGSVCANLLKIKRRT
jgi:hypothetical protein